MIFHSIYLAKIFSNYNFLQLSKIYHHGYNLSLYLVFIDNKIQRINMYPPFNDAHDNTFMCQD